MLDFLVKTVVSAGEILIRHADNPSGIRDKGSLGFVSDADLASEAYIIEEIAREFPQAEVIAEESGLNKARSSGGDLRFIVDPLDGTTNFLHRLPFFAVSIGVMDQNGLLAGAVFNPASDELFAAARGDGARVRQRGTWSKLTVSDTVSLEKALVICGFSYLEGEALDRQVARFVSMQRATKAVRRLGAASLDIAYVAAGRADGFWEESLGPWDVAGAAILVSEAGGTFTDYHGQPGDPFGSSYVFSNTTLHSTILSTLHKSQA